MAQRKTIESNKTVTRLCEESSTIGVLPAASAQRWLQAEVNSYNDFGPVVSTLARAPIVDDRQQKRGVVSDVEVAAGWVSDVTRSNLTELLQGFLFADLRQKTELVATGTTSTAYTVASGGAGFAVGSLLFGKGFAVNANNGFKVVSASTGTSVSAAGLSAGDTSGGTIVEAGFRFGSGEVEVEVSNNIPTLSRASGSKDFTDFGLAPGEWVYLGGDSAGTRFNTAGANGYFRVRSVSASAIVFDKSQFSPAADAGSSKTIDIYFGRFLKNENDETLIKRRTYTAERRLGSRDDASPNDLMAEYVSGCVPNECTFSLATQDKLTASLSYVGLDSSVIDESVSGTLLTKVGDATIVPMEETGAYNAGRDVVYGRLAPAVNTTSFPAPIVSNVENVSLSISNNVTPNKDVFEGVPAFEATAGSFAVSGSFTAYFIDVASFASIRGGVPMTFDLHLARDNAGLCIDVAELILSDGRPNVEADTAVKQPLSFTANSAAGLNAAVDFTLGMTFFDYLPTAAMPA